MSVQLRIEAKAAPAGAATEKCQRKTNELSEGYSFVRSKQVNQQTGRQRQLWSLQSYKWRPCLAHTRMHEVAADNHDEEIEHFCRNGNDRATSSHREDDQRTKRAASCCRKPAPESWPAVAAAPPVSTRLKLLGWLRAT